MTVQEELESYLKLYKNHVQKELASLLHHLDIPNQLKESMLYSIEAGGKRLRPTLMLFSFEAYNQQEVGKVLRTASALEMIHTYSLIHDDLPAMDDDDYRRGKPTNHKVFNEATAILAGDALLTYSFEAIATDSLLTDKEKVHLIQLLSKTSGPSGMVAGQILDMEAENNAVSIEQLEKIHELKTGELIKFAVYAGAYLGGATAEQLKYMNTFSYYLGLIFQVQDDILDVTGESQKLGKTVGSDESNNKSTYPKLLGLQGAIERKELYVKKAKDALQKANIMDTWLIKLTDYFSQRDY